MLAAILILACLARKHRVPIAVGAWKKSQLILLLLLCYVFPGFDQEVWKGKVSGILE